MKFLERLKKLWYIPFVLLAVLALVAASPTPRKILSENFYDWIRVHGDQPYIYMDRENDSGVFYGITVWRDYADNIEFFMGGYGVDADWLYWLVNAPGGNAITVDSQGDVGIKKTPAANVELDVAGDIDASGQVEAEHLKSTDDAEIADDLTVGGDIYATGVYGAYLYAGAGGLEVDGNTTVAGVTASGQVQAEHLKSTDDAEIADDLDVGGDLDVDGTLFAEDVVVFDEMIVEDYLGVGSCGWGCNEDTLRVAPGREGADNAYAQTELINLYRYVELNDATWYDLLIEGDHEVFVAYEGLMTFRALVSVADDGSTEVAAYEIVGAVENDDGTITIQYESVTTLYEDDGSWDVRLAANSADDTFTIQIRDADGPGSGGDEVMAVATLITSEVSHGGWLGSVGCTPQQ